ncbi:MAG: hypothetical protein JNK53_07770 [Phycisphaerae bacterium]|nr:hypothetical protein [Phycisphaerae bacterium]
MRRKSLLETKQLCERRVRRERDAGIARDIGAFMRAAKQDERRNSKAAEALERALPAPLLADAWIESATAAQITIGVESAAAAYQVDRAMREGALAALRVSMGAPMLRVRTRVGTQPDS